MIRLLVSGMAVGDWLMLFNCWKAGVSLASIWNTFVRWCWDVSALCPWSTLHRPMWESRPDADSSSAPAPWWESLANLHPPAQIGKDWFRLWVLSRRRLGAEPCPAGCLKAFPSKNTRIGHGFPSWILAAGLWRIWVWFSILGSRVGEHTCVGLRGVWWELRWRRAEWSGYLGVTHTTKWCLG